MSDEKEIGENCTFIFKKRCLKSRGTRKRQQSSSDEGKTKIAHNARKFLRSLFCSTEDKSSSDEATTSVVRPTKRKLKSNPNVQCTKRLIQREKAEDSDGSSGEEEVVSVSYKSKKSAMPEGPQDQGATAILVSTTNIQFALNCINYFAFTGNRNGKR